jgi:acetyl esterase/lipase
VTLKTSVMRGLARLALTRIPATLIGRRRQRGVDRDLDPQVAAVLELQRRMKLTAIETYEPAKARVVAEQGLSLLDVALEPMKQIVETAAMTTYVPHGASDDWIVYLHGGGGVIGSVKGSEAVTRLIAAQTKCSVASVEYRLGPEHKHPAAIDDAVAAFETIRARAKGRVVVAGDSFGGFLATHVARRAKPDLQVLIYPLTDSTMGKPSIDRHADGYLLTKSLIEWFRSNYFHATDDRRAASPLFWTDPPRVPAIVITAGFDPLVDEGDAYAELLEAAGVRVIHRRYPSLVHGFLSLSGGVKAGRAAIDEMCRDIVAELTRPARTP